MKKFLLLGLVNFVILNPSYAKEDLTLGQYLATPPACAVGVFLSAGSSVLETVPVLGGFSKVAAYEATDGFPFGPEKFAVGSYSGGALSTIADVIFMTFDMADGGKIKDTDDPDENYNMPFQFTRHAYAGTKALSKQYLWGDNALCSKAAKSLKERMLINPKGIKSSRDTNAKVDWGYSDPSIGDFHEAVLGQ